ncbi:MAG: aminopeptidase C [Flavobacteriales bacterium]
MKNLLMLLSVACFIGSASAQDKQFYQFTDLVNLEHTSTKDQCRTGTCWSYATSSFIESELLRMGKGEHDLSEMFNVRMTYPEKVRNYIRYQGKTQFSAGSLSHDVINSIRKHGVVPQSVYSGLKNGETVHNHGEMDNVLEAMTKSLVDNSRGSLSDSWSDAVDGVLDAYLGEVPTSFEVEGKKYTPESYRDELGLNADDYYSFSSFTHHPFYEEFVLEVPDNFSGGEFYNVQMDELVQMTEAALKNGYTVAWDADVSEKGFSFRNGMALLLDKDVPKDKMFTEKQAEMAPDQASRQAAYESYSTTDDHLMHIIGMAKDQFGQPYFIIKNSWGDENPYGGKQYISYPYFKMKTVGIMLHKGALTKAITKKLK